MAAVHNRTGAVKIGSAWNNKSKASIRPGQRKKPQPTVSAAEGELFPADRSNRMNVQARNPLTGARIAASPARPSAPLRQKVRLMLIVMAGLPGTGKSSLAAALQPLLGAVILNKDTVRAVLFPAPVLDYSTAQDDVCMAAIYQAAAVILKALPRQAVIIDGRTFLRSYQIHDVLALAASLNAPAHFIECVCEDDIAKARLESDLAQGKHPAGNRTYALYLTLKAAAEPITIPRLILDTGKTSLEECVKRSIAVLGERP